MSSETPERLKLAVENLLFSKGESSITLRDITEAADANVAAVAYHFGSKDKLISQVFSEAIDTVTSLQVQRFENLSDKHTLRELVEVWLHPLLSNSGPDDREAKLWRLIQRGAVEKSPGLLVNMGRASSPVENTLLPLLASHLTHLDARELIFRHNAVMGGLAGFVSTPIGMDPEAHLPNSSFREYTIAWIIGSLMGDPAIIN